MFVGSEDHVLRSREHVLEQVRDLFDELELAYHVETANDPFFPGDETQQARLQRELQLKWEVRARLPFDGSTLAVGSYNYHLQYFGRSLNITGPSHTPVHTGCVGFGLERLAYAFLAQYGLHPAAWPRPVRDAISRDHPET
jgi:seryl-tRNA synthetase